MVETSSQIDGSCEPRPFLAAGDNADVLPSYPEVGGDALIRFAAAAAPADFLNIGLGKFVAPVLFAANAGGGAVLDLVCRVFGFGSPSKIFRSVVGRIPVQVSALHPTRAWACERLKHKAVDRALDLFSPDRKPEILVSTPVFSRVEFPPLRGNVRLKAPPVFQPASPPQTPHAHSINAVARIVHQLNDFGMVHRLAFHRGWTLAGVGEQDRLPAFSLYHLPPAHSGRFYFAAPASFKATIRSRLVSRPVKRYSPVPSFPVSHDVMGPRPLGVIAGNSRVGRVTGGCEMTSQPSEQSRALTGL